MKVADASVILSVLMKDRLWEEAKRELEEGGVVVPDWAFVEIANTLATKSGINEKEIRDLFGLVYEMGMEIRTIDRGMLEEAMMEAKIFGVAVYDMIYAVLARKLGVDLVTVDKKFVEKVGWDFVKLLG